MILGHMYWSTQDEVIQMLHVVTCESDYHQQMKKLIRFELVELTPDEGVMYSNQLKIKIV